MSKAKTSPSKTTPMVFAKNKRALHDYEVLETLEAGLCLLGSEVKAIRDGKIQLTDAYVVDVHGELFIAHMKIQEYAWANQFHHAIDRRRKLLLHKKQILRLIHTMKLAGQTVIPLQIYQNDGTIKALIGVCKGKKQYDKRMSQKEKDNKRELQRIVRHQAK